MSEAMAEDQEALNCPPTLVKIVAPTPDGDSWPLELNLHLNNEWTSSCFCSHPQGYKLLLALKSTEIPTASKPKLSIAVVAISPQPNDGQHRSWPCRGEITIKLIGQQNCESFTTNFSINQPVNIVNALSDVKKWTPLPANAIPFRGIQHGHAGSQSVKNLGDEEFDPFQTQAAAAPLQPVSYTVIDTRVHELKIEIQSISIK